MPIKRFHLFEAKKEIPGEAVALINAISKATGMKVLGMWISESDWLKSEESWLKNVYGDLWKAVAVEIKVEVYNCYVFQGQKAITTFTRAEGIKKLKALCENSVEQITLQPKYYADRDKIEDLKSGINDKMTPFIVQEHQNITGGNLLQMAENLKLDLAQILKNYRGSILGHDLNIA